MIIKATWEKTKESSPINQRNVQQKLHSCNNVIVLLILKKSKRNEEGNIAGSHVNIGLIQKDYRL